MRINKVIDKRNSSLEIIVRKVEQYQTQHINCSIEEACRENEICLEDYIHALRKIFEELKRKEAEKELTIEEKKRYNRICELLEELQILDREKKEEHKKEQEVELEEEEYEID